MKRAIDSKPRVSAIPPRRIPDSLVDKISSRLPSSAPGQSSNARESRSCRSTVLVGRTSPNVCGVVSGCTRDRRFVRVHTDDLNRRSSPGSTVIDKRCRSKDHFGSARSVDIGRFARRHDTSIRPRRPADTIAATKSASHSDLAPRVPTLVPGCLPGSQACSRLRGSFLAGFFCLCFSTH